jgi:AcrR family transcriptional regulator
MGARADAAAETHQRILRTAIRLLSERPYDDVSLADIAGEAEVTVQTVLRRFESKEGLVEAGTALALEEVRTARFTPNGGDVAAIIAGLMAHYEEWGERSLRFLAQEQRIPAMKRITDSGRALHHEWVGHAFGARLALARGNERVRLRARLIAATDVYVWKIMRHDLGLDANATELAIRELVAAILK